MGASFKLLLVGCGKMGGAVLKRILELKLASEIWVVNPSPLLKSYEGSSLRWCKNPTELDPSFQPDLIILAVKPQIMPAVLPLYKHYQTAVFLSLAAGLTLTKLTSLLDGSYALIRAMPNLPASVGQGMSVAIANTAVTSEQKTYADQCLRAIGAVAWIDQEELMDAVTALSGSGPAYVFALCEMMAKSGEALGLSASLASQLARQTVIGSAALLHQSTDDVTTLRQAVTSRGGTTEAALSVLFADEALPDLLKRAMQAAVERSKQLAQ
jgi:pyrroline-5-carboxylate reductase